MVDLYVDVAVFEYVNILVDVVIVFVDVSVIFVDLAIIFLDVGVALLFTLGGTVMPSALARRFSNTKLKLLYKISELSYCISLIILIRSFLHMLNFTIVMFGGYHGRNHSLMFVTH